MDKQYTKLNIDLDTYQIIGTLSIELGLTRSAYIRALIHSQLQARNRPFEEVTIEAQEKLVKAPMVIRHGELVPLSDLNFIQRNATRIAQRFNITIDTRRWAKSLVGNLEKQVEAPEKR